MDTNRHRSLRELTNIAAQHSIFELDAGPDRRDLRRKSRSLREGSDFPAFLEL